MPRKPNAATSVADLLFNTLDQMHRWGASFEVDRVTDTTMVIVLTNENETVQVRVSRVKEKK